jgi:hypothetical protein
MALPPKTKKIVTEDFKEAPAWFAKFLAPLNEFMTSVADALTGRLTRAENFLGYYEEVDFTTAAVASDTFPLKFKNKLLGGVRPRSVYVGRIKKYNGVRMSAAYSIEWDLNQQGEIEVVFIGLENGTRYLGTLVFDA